MNSSRKGNAITRYFPVGRGDLDIHDLCDASRDHISRGHECIELKTLGPSSRRATQSAWAHSVRENDEISCTMQKRT